jgi:hypothetical protein
MSIRTIPRQLLIHSAIYKANPIKNAYGKVTSRAVTKTLQHIRVEPSTSMRVTTDNKQIQLAAIVFYDAMNSTPQGIKFDVGAVIDFDGYEHTILSIKPIYDNSKLHHTELELI